MMKIEDLSVVAAQQVFEQLPFRICTLSPAFALADVAREDGLRCVHLAVRDGKETWLNSIHLKRLVPDTSKFGAISPYGYGGPVCSTTEASFVRGAWKAYNDWCIHNAVLAEFARFHPIAANHRFFGGVVQENRQTVSVDLTLEDLACQYNALTRRKIRRAASIGARARFSQDVADWERYGPFYRAAMTAMNADMRYHFGDAYFESLRQVVGAWLCICENGEGWLSAGVYFFGQNDVEYHLGASSTAGYQACTPHLMQHAAALRGKAEGRSSLYLGGGVGSESDNPLLFHKRGFSRRLLPFFVGHTVHDESGYWAVAAKAGFDQQNPPARIILD